MKYKSEKKREVVANDDTEIEVKKVKKRRLEECEPPNTDVQRGIQGQKTPIFNPKSPNLEGGLSQICSIFTELAKNNSIDSNGEFTGRKSDSKGKIIGDSNG